MTRHAPLTALALLVATGALADPPAEVEGWVAVKPVDEVVIPFAQAHLQTTDGCRPATIDDGELTTVLCTQEQDEVTTTCRWTMTLEQAWRHGSMTCERGMKTWGVGYGGSDHGPLQLVEATSDRAVWRYVTPLVARPERSVREITPCTPDSLAALREQAPEGADVATWLAETHGIEDGERRCDTSTGVQVGPRRRSMHGVGIARTVDAEADCTDPCAPNPSLERIRELDSWLSDRVFTRAEGATVALFTEAAACESWEPPAHLELPEGQCEGPERQ